MKAVSSDGAHPKIKCPECNKRTCEFDASVATEPCDDLLRHIRSVERDLNRSITTYSVQVFCYGSPLRDKAEIDPSISKKPQSK